MILRRTSKYSWSYVPSTGSRPDHITPNRTCMWKIYVDNRRLQCNVWQRSVRWCGTMFRPQELRSRANESSSSWGQYLRSGMNKILRVEYPSGQVPKLNFWSTVYRLGTWLVLYQWYPIIVETAHQGGALQTKLTPWKIRILPLTRFK